MVIRIGLQLVPARIVSLVEPLLTVARANIAGRDLILGGLFLVYNSTTEIHGSLEGEEGATAAGVKATFAAVVASVALVSDHPTIKMLALSLLVVVGVVLIAKGSCPCVPKGYIDFGMAFALGVEMLNIRTRKRAAKPVGHAQRVRPTTEGVMS